ncbi:hypothetical protein AAF712_003958 [Marasmius tenuissimus]|uniref:Uncharacterized protein n=1 Tax=Marasmius tenuissimus TaxID=585030 RepID=A0ABR3A5Z9_9AGAR
MSEEGDASAWKRDPEAPTSIGEGGISISEVKLDKLSAVELLELSEGVLSKASRDSLGGVEPRKELSERKCFWFKASLAASLATGNIEEKGKYLRNQLPESMPSMATRRGCLKPS